MLIPRREDAIHKAWLLRLLTAICEQPTLSQNLGFKGGTCAAMRGFLNRFSIDLDFDLLADGKKKIPTIIIFYFFDTFVASFRNLIISFS